MGSLYPDCLIEPITGKEDDFRKKLFVHTRLLSVIEDDKLKQYTLQSIPVDELTIKATQMLSTLENDYCLEDCLILELLQWFKFSFFTWVDIPDCHKCGKPTVYRDIVTPTSDELMWLARTVEHYYCETCQVYTRFPRYNHPRKLLETRKGRCGEWGSCFALICRALDLDTRLVVDWNDHIWIETFSPLRQKWMHCDPCENIHDQPLMYEVGWKKDMLFVIAFSKDEVQDVTWRYTKKFAEVLKRRKAFNCREKFVLALISYYTEKCRSNADSEKLNFLQKRQALELAEFLSPPKEFEETPGGRTSGSLSWRIARREISAESSPNSHVFNLSAIEIEKKHFHLQYSCSLDEYVRVSNNLTKITEFSSLAYEVKDIFRKVETDWKMSYLARAEGSSKGMIVWKFDFEKSGLVIQTLKLNLHGKTFHSGRIRWHLSPIKSSGPRVEKVYNEAVLGFISNGSEEFRGAIGLTISAEISEGDGDAAWQHAQLFRQELSSTEFPFEVEIFLEKI